MTPSADRDQLLAEIATLRAQLEEAQETLLAIHSGAVDALIVESPQGPRIFALEGADHPYRILVEEMSDGAATLSADGVVLYCNRRFAQLVRAPQERVIGATLTSFIAPADAPAVAGLLQTAATARAEAELTGRSADGSPLILYLALSPLPADSAARICLLIADLTERRAQEHALQRAQKLEALGTLAGGIAHDFNNVLLAIDGNARLAMADLPTSHPAHVCLLEVVKGAARATALVRQILAFSRPQEVQRESLALQPVVAEVVGLLRATLPARVEIRSELGPAPPVLADVGELHQLIVNLATNAAYAMPPFGGTVTIRVDTVEIDAQEPRTAPRLPAGLYACLTVHDTGCGMDAAILKRIFDPFFTTKPAGEGSGLGLSIVHNIVKSCRGFIDVDSAPGRGTTFRVFLPEGPPVHATAAEAPASLRATGTGQHILYVDDDEALIYLLTRVLQKLGYTVTGHGRPAAALKAFGDHPDAFDAIVTDLSMPGMSGFDLARAALAIRPEIPVVMMSGYVRQEDQTEAARLGIRTLIEKPDSMDDLGRALDRIFRTARIADHSRAAHAE